MPYSKELEVRYTTNVFVAGGDAAGVAATLTSDNENVKEVKI